MTPTERKVLAAARRWYQMQTGTYQHSEGAEEEQLTRIYRASAADAAARKKARKKSPKWKPETPSPYDLSEGKRK